VQDVRLLDTEKKKKKKKCALTEQERQQAEKLYHPTWNKTNRTPWGMRADISRHSCVH
jgi:hypothetical protein